MATLERMPFEAQNKIFKKLAKIADSKTLSREDQEKYDESMRIMWDNFATMKSATNLSKEEIEKLQKQNKGN